MVGFHVCKEIEIQSHKGKYSVLFSRNGLDELNDNPIKDAVYIIDSNVAEIYKERLSNIINGRVLCIEAKEENKSLDKFTSYVSHLVKLSVRRGQPLVAIGGGIIQDITCFLATTMMRGLPWVFYPTTLLAQADSCIGSKSSINSGEIKNILGTFTPPEKIIIDVNFLSTLKDEDINSGIGEMIKVHAIDAPESLNRIAGNYDKLLSDNNILESYIYDSLLIKKKLIELDEFDQGPRNVMNYGHSFGHAIESATNFEIPHGIAVTIGMDMANYVSVRLGVSKDEHYQRMHAVMKKNYRSSQHVNIDVNLLINALQKDKKNTATQLRLILPNNDGKIEIGLYDNDDNFKCFVKDFIIKVYEEK